MMRFAVVVILLLIGAAGVVASMMVDKTSDTAALSQSVDLAEGEKLYQQYCASCHGSDLEGQAGWRSAGDDGVLPAPPHDETGHTWHHPDSVLFNYTKFGGKKVLASQGMDFESGMPGFGDQLNDGEIRNILAFIKSTWPERQREVQADRSAAEQQKRGD